MMIKYIMFILQYKVSTTVIDLIVVFALLVFMLVRLRFCVAAVFRWIKIYISGGFCSLKWGRSRLTISQGAVLRVGRMVTCVHQSMYCTRGRVLYTLAPAPHRDRYPISRPIIIHRRNFRGYDGYAYPHTPTYKRYKSGYLSYTTWFMHEMA